MRSRDQLFDEVVTAIVDSRHRPPRKARSWTQALYHYAEVLWETLVEHPTVVEVLQRSVTATESVLPDLERISVLAERAGLRPAELADSYETVWTFVLGYAATVHARVGRDERALREARADAIVDDHPHAADLARALVDSDRVEAFPRRLRALVDGLAAG